jgi:signal transduction histidine kinase
MSGVDDTAPAQALAGRRPRVLVVEDDDAVRRAIVRLLSEEYEVDSESSGLSACERLDRLDRFEAPGCLEAHGRREDEEPDVVLTDVMLPGRDGFAILARVKGDPRLRGVPVLMLTARASLDDLVDGLGRGADDYIGKPFNGAELRARVAAAYRARTLQRELALRTQALEAALAELAEAQQQAIERAKLAAIGTMVAGLAHELNNPLGIVLAQAERALRTNLEPRARDALASILRQSGRCVSLTRSLLALSRDEVSKKTRASVQSALESVVEAARPQADERHVEIVLRVSVELPSVLASDGDLETAIGNLLRNAVQASPTGLAVEVEARRRAHAHAHAHEGVEIVVRDRGPGIPAELRDRVFEPFFTTKEPGQGTGLGLALARCAVERCGGSLELEPTEAGLAARLWLPVAEAP